MFENYIKTRNLTEEICRPLQPEDYVPQPMEDVSPPKWHLAHTTWFFEQFILVPYLENYKLFDDQFAYLFNSYYNNMGTRVERNQRGFMTRPVVDIVYEYRHHVDAAMQQLLKLNNNQVNKLTELGIHHEQQHQELLIYDIKYILGSQPTAPVYGNKFQPEQEKQSAEWLTIPEGVYEVGVTENDHHFSYDNESPKHKVFLSDFSLRSQLVTNREYLEFIEHKGYENFNLWHEEGWKYIQSNQISAPLYWKKINGTWHTYTLNGNEPIQLDAPVQHISLYEAAAFAEWYGSRLPTEFEWEIAAGRFHWGTLWEWTNSAYLPYPGYKKASGALGEYNGKFMINQHVLRGGSIATSPAHSRASYRNFFYPATRWAFNGIRLAN